MLFVLWTYCASLCAPVRCQTHYLELPDPPRIAAKTLPEYRHLQRANAYYFFLYLMFFQMYCVFCRAFDGLQPPMGPN